MRNILFLSTFLFMLSIISCENCSCMVELIGTSINVQTTEETISLPDSSKNSSFVMIEITFAKGANEDSILLGEDVLEVPYQTTVKPFRLARYETSYNTWYSVRQWALSNGYVIQNTGHEGAWGTVESVKAINPGPNPPKLVEMPIFGVSWRDAIVWCNALSEMKGLTPVYYTDEKHKNPIKDSTGTENINELQIEPGQVDNPYVRKDANGFRLPYTAEWEYAARKRRDGTFRSGRNVPGDDDGGSISPTAVEVYNGITFPKSTKQLNYTWDRYSSAGNCEKTASGQVDTCSNINALLGGGNISGRRTHLSGGKLPADLGFYDMAGNVNEWCFEYNLAYGSTYKFSTMRTCRGGDYVNDVSGSRRAGNPGGALLFHKNGFRIAQNAN